MKVEIWSDVVCPFCYIGKRYFEHALDKLPFQSDVEVVYRSFQLDPNAELNSGMSMHDVLAQKYGMSLERAKAMNAQMAERAEAVGLTYHFDSMIPTNTLDAHRLMHYAAAHGKMEEMTERLFKAYFTDSKHVGDRETLATLAEDIGLEKSDALATLNGDAYTDAVRTDQRLAQQFGIQGVPFFVIDRKYAVSGAQPVDVFVDALQQAHNDETKLVNVTTKNEPASISDTDVDGTMCADGVCEIPDDKD